MTDDLVIQGRRKYKQLYILKILEAFFFFLQNNDADRCHLQECIFLTIIKKILVLVKTINYPGFLIQKSKWRLDSLRADGDR